jgi:uncharacterized cupin superfamily protein
MNIPSEVPSFIDLKQFARASRPSVGEAPLARRCVPLSPGSVSVGALHIEPGRYTETIGADEFVIVCDGVVTLHGDAATLSLAPGQSAVIRSGSVVRWETEAQALLVFMRYNAAPADSAGIVPIDYEADLVPSGPPLAELLTTPTPACRNFTDYRSADAEFVCGTWDSTPYARRAMHYRHHELMYLLEGEVSFEDAAGAQATFVRGDIFLVRQDSECSWDSKVHVHKVYAIWRPA